MPKRLARSRLGAFTFVALAASAAGAVIVDDFDDGAFGPLVDSTTGDGPEVLGQSGLHPSHVFEGRRTIQAELLGGDPVSAGLVLTGADDGIVFDLPADAAGSFATSYLFSTDFDLTADGSDALVVTAPGLPPGITMTAQFVHGPTGDFTFSNQFSGGGDSYVFAFDDFVWNGAQGSFDAVSSFAFFIGPQFNGSPRSLTVTDIRTLPEPSRDLLIAVGAVAAGLLPRRREGSGRGSADLS